MQIFEKFYKARDTTDIYDNSRQLIINSCGYEKFEYYNNSHARENGRKDYQIIYFVNGKGVFKFEGIEKEVNKGSIVVFVPGQPQFYNYNYRDNTENYFVHFTGYAAGEHLSHSGFFNGYRKGQDCTESYYIAGSNPHPACFIGIHEDCINLFKTMILEMQLREPYFEARISAALAELIAVMGRHREYCNNNELRKPDEGIKKVVEEMYRKYNQNFPVEYYAGISNLSLFWFSHKFREVTGMTPTGYIRQIRLDRAKYLLSNTSLNVNEIAYETGYQNTTYFSFLFRNITGMSPICYRKIMIDKRGVQSGDQVSAKDVDQ